MWMRVSATRTVYSHSLFAAPGVVALGRPRNPAGMPGLVPFTLFKMG